MKYTANVAVKYYDACTLYTDAKFPDFIIVFEV